MTEWKAFEDCTRKQLLTTCYALEDQRDRAIQRAERAEAEEKQALAREAESTREAYRLRDRQRDHYEATLARVREVHREWETNLGPVCLECGSSAPCPTVCALEGGES